MLRLERVTLDDDADESQAAVCRDTIVFASNRDGDWNVFTKPVAQRESVRLTSSPAEDVEPSVTADCGSLAFASNREGAFRVYTVSGLMGGPVTRGDAGASPAWSRDGSWLYFSRYLPVEGTSSVWRASPSTGRTAQLVDGFQPAPSPDGRTLALARLDGRTRRSSIWLLDLRTQGEVEILRRPDASVLRPVWSPDGSRLLVTVARELSFREGVISTGGSDLAVIRRDGTGFTMLTDNPANDVGEAWSDDGWIYFSSLRERSYDVWRFRPRLP
jgi:Tol biopolymer transport system component